jgi:hypothetical protein
MSQAYAPALEVSAATHIEKVRELPLPGKSLVAVGDFVAHGDTVLTAELPGDLMVVRIADRLGFEPEDVLPNCVFKEGDTIVAGQVLCEMKTFFGLFSSQVVSPVSGVVEFFTPRNAHLGIRQAPKPVSVNAYVSGEVVSIESGKRVAIRATGALIQGVFGVGGECHGTIVVLDAPLSEVITVAILESAREKLAGAVLIGGSCFSLAAITYAAAAGVKAIVTGSIDAETLSSYVGKDIGVSITGDEDIPTTLIITEGFGSLPLSQRVFDLAATLQGKQASVNGATQVRAGATRPEVIVCNESPSSEVGESKTRILSPGVAIRMIRVPYFGAFAEVVELPHDLQEIESGAKVRVLKARLSDGREVIVPRANVELI